MELEERLVRFLVDTRYEDIPEKTIQTMKRSVADTFGVLCAGSSAPDIQELLLFLKGRNKAEEASAAVFGDRLSVTDAAWLNGAMIRSREFDDSDDHAGDHSSTPVFPSGMAIAEMLGQVSGQDFLTAYALATEFNIRLRMAPRTRVGAPSQGFAANSYAPFSAAIMAGKLMKFNYEQMYNALGWAYAQMAGAVQVQQCGSSVLQIQHGLAASQGVNAALLSRAGFAGIEHFLTGKFGLYNAYVGGNYDPEVIENGLGERYYATDIGTKPYPCGRIIQAPIEAALELRAQIGGTDEIESLSVRYTKGGVNMTCQPEARHFPSTFQHAKFSLYYGIAAALVYGKVGVAEYEEEAIRNPKIRETIEKITVIPDESLGQEMPPGLIEAKLKDGRTICIERRLSKGTAARPYTMDEIIEKLRACLPFSAKPLSEKKVETAVARLRSFEEEENISDMMRLFTAENEGGKS